MEMWTTVLVAFIVALSTLGGTVLQSWFSNKRSMIEIGRAIDVDVRKRRWEVRGEPLLKLRAELADMATKADRLAAVVWAQQNRIGVTEEQAGAEFQSARDDWNTYVASGDFAQALFTQCDMELINKIEDIRKDYQGSTFVFLTFPIHKDVAKYSEAMKIVEKNKARIVEVQELINKRLEGL